MLALLTKFLAREARARRDQRAGQALETVPRGRAACWSFPGVLILYTRAMQTGRGCDRCHKTRDAEEPSLLYGFFGKNADKGVIDIKQAEERALRIQEGECRRRR